MNGAGTPANAPDDFGSSHLDVAGQQANGAYSPDPVNLATGSFTAHAEDLALPGRVLGLSFTRWFNSADPTTGPLGPGWTHTFNWSVADAGATVKVRHGDGRLDTFTRAGDGSYAGPPGVFDTLTRNGDGSFTLAQVDLVTYAFAVTGMLTRISEPAGNQIALAYAGPNLVRITDTVGRVVRLAYDTSNRLTSIEDPLGRRATYAYDGAGRLATVTDRLGNAPGGVPAAHRWQYAYDGTTRHLASVTDPDGRIIVRNTYDAQGRVVEQRDGLGARTTMAYGTLQTTLTDPRGHATTYTFDGRLRVLTQSDVVGAATLSLAYAYDAAGNRTSVTDRAGSRTELTFDARGNVLTKLDPAPSPGAVRPLTRFEYDARNNLIRLTDAAGFATANTYDPVTNLLRSTARDAGGGAVATTTYAYGDPANPGLPTRIVSPRGNLTALPDPAFATVLGYDAQGNLTSRTDPDGATSTFAYDAVGRLVSFVDPEGNAPGGVPAEHTWSITYDELDRETSRTDPLANALRYAYDGAGNRTSLTDRRGNRTSYVYDADARLQGVAQKPDPAGPTVYATTITRDPTGNATRIAQANGALTDYAYDALGRLTSVTTHPDARTDLTTSYVLDGNGQPTTRTTGDGVTVTYAYDALARLTSVSGPSLSITYAYDALGRRTRMTDATGATTSSYDGLGRLTQVAAPGGTLGYTYDRDGNRTALGYPGGQRVTYAYSPGGRLSTVTDWTGRTSTYTYRASGLVARLAYPNGTVATYAYDRAQRLTELRYTRPAGRSEEAGRSETALFGQRLTLDAEGDRTAIEEVGAAERGRRPLEGRLAMRYDGLGRLSSLERLRSGGRPASETFRYDGATNLVSRTGPAAAYAIDGANRVTSDGVRAFVWDGADRLTARGADRFRYDPLGRLTGAIVAGATRTYGYDGNGLLRRRVGPPAAAPGPDPEEDQDGADDADREAAADPERDDGEGPRAAPEAATAFLWDTAVAPAPLLQAGTDRVVHGLGPLYLARADGRTLTLVRDALGSVRAELDDHGVVRRAFRYAAYGAVAQRSPARAAPTLLGFAGELADPSGLLYLRARWYDPGAARFLSRDAYLGLVLQPSSLNGFGYVDGSPVNSTDPTGHCPWCIVAGASIGGAASLAGYWVTAKATGQPFRLDQAAVAFGAGALSGGVCGASLFLTCIGASSVASVVQYHLSPGDKSTLGYAATTMTGALAGRFTVGRTLPHYPYSPALMRQISWAANNERMFKLAANFLRSLVATGLTSLGQSISAASGEDGK